MLLENYLDLDCADSSKELFLEYQLCIFLFTERPNQGVKTYLDEAKSEGLVRHVAPHAAANTSQRSLFSMRVNHSHFQKTNNARPDPQTAVQSVSPYECLLVRVSNLPGCHTIRVQMSANSIRSHSCY